MERKITSAGEFEEAIKNFSKISLEVDSLINSGNADAHKLKNKSMEDRNDAIEIEAHKRLNSQEMDKKAAKSKESLRKQLVLEEVKSEFDKGVEEQKIKLRGDSAMNLNIETKKSENASDEESEDGSDDDTDDGSTDSDTTNKDSSDEDSTDDSDDDNTDDDKDEVKIPSKE